MCRHLCKTIGITKNQGNVTLPKEQSTFPVTDLKGMEIQELPNKELKIIILKMLRELQEIQII